ncbi:MAG: hypothetical protein LBU32_19890 [Clostridiales bacterium]|jgi:hypothetical protein|nr:hypothetical protein [Clostridiales bacterium]
MKTSYESMREAAELLNDDTLREMAKHLDGRRKPKIALLYAHANALQIARLRLTRFYTMPKL